MHRLSFGSLLFALLLAASLLHPALSRDYCVSSDHGNNNNNGTLVVGNPSTCWASSVAAQNALNSAVLMPGDRILYCQGDRLFQDGWMIGFACITLVSPLYL